LKGTCEVLDLGFSSSATPAAAFGGLYFRDSKGRFSRLDLRARAVDWRKKERGDFDRSCPAVDDERVYFAAHGAVRAFDPSTGERIWEFPLNRMIHTSPVVAGDRVYFGADDGFVRMLDAAKGTELKSFDLGHAIVGSFAIAKGRLFVADGVKGDLHAIE
jgi:eukaryotic-like serine/threonine-protein kinase